MNLTCYKLQKDAAELVPARSVRLWMDVTTDRFAYRCSPMTAANALGWELLVPEAFTATWTGGKGLDDTIFRGNFPKGGTPRLASSHFGHGIITFHPGYLFRTDPGWGLICRGAPNWPKDGIVALEGYVETDWLPFPFTMNWQFTRSGTVTFEAGEPFCFIALARPDQLETIQPVIRSIEEAPKLHDEFAAWRDSRNAFNKMLGTKSASETRGQWQKFYVRGKTAAGTEAAETHKTKRSMKDPLEGED